MTVTQERVIKRTATLGHLDDVHPSLHHLPIKMLRDLGNGGNEPGNLDAAGAAAELVYKNWNNVKWRNGFILGLISYIDDQVAYHRAELQHLLDKSQQRVVKKARQAIVKAYVTDALEEVAKDRINVRGYTTRQGRRVSSYHQERTRAQRERESNPAFGGYDPALGYGENLSTRSQQRQAGAAMAAQMVDAYGQAQGDRSYAQKQAVEYHVMKPDGKIEVHRPAPGQGPSIDRENDIIVRAKPLGFAKPVHLGQSHFNVAQALGVPPDEASRQGAIVQHFQSAVSAETGDWGKRLIGMANVLHHATKGANPQVEAAIAMGRAVGQAGPEVSKVLGGHIRRHLYRYRGVQADPSQWTNVARSGRQKDSKGEPESIEAYQAKLSRNLAASTAKGGLQAVPTLEEVNTALKTGNTPPSHGFLLDKNGVVKSQAHGYADDHYVPFNLAQLHALDNGSYVRSRSFGGPTTEDFSLASRTGAQSFETVSRHGIFRVEFTPRTNKRGRKVGEWARDTANDANTAMVNRYGRILDAIKHGNVNDPANPGQTLKLDARGYDVALETLRKQFPYFIKKVEYTAPNSISELQALHGSNEDDRGYVRPYYLKPQTARAGYWDPKLRTQGDPTSYDEDDRYRLGMARLLVNRRPPSAGGSGAAPGGVVGGGGPAPRGTPGMAPTTVPQGARDTAAAARTQDIGAPISEAARDLNKIDATEMPAYIEWVRAALAEAPPDIFNGHDAEAKEARRVRDMFMLDPFDAPDPRRANDEQESYLYAIQHDPDARAELEKLLYQITPDSAESAYWDRPVLESLGEQPDEELAETPEEVHASEEGQEYRDFVFWRNKHQAVQRGQALSAANQAKYEHLDKIWNTPTTIGSQAGRTRADRYSQDVIPETGLTGMEEFENRLAEAEGVEPPHSPKVREEQIAESAHLTQQEGEPDAAYEARMSTALESLASQGGEAAPDFPPQGEDESDEDYERRSDAWIERMTRGLDDRDY